MKSGPNFFKMTSSRSYFTQNNNSSKNPVANAFAAFFQSQDTAPRFEVLTARPLKNPTRIVWRILNPHF
ncbi:MAG: hypothetical protein NVS9B5_34150 [Terriglobales bacterium]